jgi:hypothetical protein
MLGEVSLLTVIGLLKWLRFWKGALPKVSTYLPSKVLRCQAKRSSSRVLTYVGAFLRGRPESRKKGAPTESKPVQFRQVGHYRTSGK